VAAAATVTGDIHAWRQCAPGECRMHVVGYLRGPRPDGLDCDSPLRVVCRYCDVVGVWRCSNHRESRCKPCAGRYRRRVLKVADSGRRRWGSQPGFLYFLTLTAPGDDRMHRRQEPDGSWVDCDCSVGADLAAWNASHSSRWNRLRTALRKQYPGLEFWRGIEVQRRGALHDHALVYSPVAVSEAEVRRLARLAGFGHEMHMPPVKPGSRREAYYVAKYVAKACDSRSDVPWLGERVDTRTGEVTVGEVEARYRTWSMSRQWGLTMADVRAEAAAYAAVCREREEAASLDRALEALAGLLAEPEPQAERSG